MKTNLLLRVLNGLLALILCLGMMSCSTEKAPESDANDDPDASHIPDIEPLPDAPQDGEIGGRAPVNGLDSPEGVDDSKGGAIWDAPVSSDEPMEPMPPMLPDSVDGYYGGDVIGGYVTGGGNISYQAGMLTGAEWRDNDNYADFIDKLNAQDNGWYDIAARWDLITTERIHVHVTDGATPVKQATVHLHAGGVLFWQAVTDADGDAYLFPYLDGSTAANVPMRVTVTTADGQETVELAAGQRELTVSMQADAAALRLDLMFVVDTTGSMGDELEYLKAELGDVVRRASQNGQMPVRTSVNFYRDEGDEYVVRYFDFREDVDEAVRLISQQSANGGGDYEEAVHTALDNAVNGHSWDVGAVKLLFLVLDAPPHETDEVIASIGATVRAAAAQGIRIIPVSASGVNTQCEVLFRSWAMLTGGTYTYLTNHSGIGNDHHEPDVEETTVEMLNDMLVRIIGEYCR